MPGFIKTPGDEKRWAKAKEAANKTLSESAGDSYWKLVNSIYQKMTKSTDDIEAIETILLKARRRLSDEAADDDYDEPSPEEMGMREFDPDEESEGSDWLKENDPDYGKDEEEPDHYDEYAPGEDEEAHQRDEGMGEEPVEEEDLGEEIPRQQSGTVQQVQEKTPAVGQRTKNFFNYSDADKVENMDDLDEAKAEAHRLVRRQAGARPENHSKAAQMIEGATSPQELAEGMRRFTGGYSAARSLPMTSEGEGRFPQPSREELADMRRYARPWEQRAREKTRLEAEASKNPVLAHEGKLVEARNLSHRDHQDAYAKLQSSPEYQGADPITQMEMDSKFETDWHKQNPDYLANAGKAHAQAHAEGLKGMGEGAKAKKEAIQHIRMGGAQPDDPMSAEEAMQHAGGTKGEEGTVGTMVHDPAAKFAREHQKFVTEEGGKHEGRAAAREGFYSKKAQEYAGKHGEIPEYQKGDVSKILGDHPAMKDPKNKAKVDSFFQKYHPMINMNAHRVLKQLGLDKGSIDMGLLHEAGMHGLFQAINDYNHDNPGKATFATHAGNKMRGLMQTALKDQQATPLQTEAKKYNLKQVVAKHPPDVADRMKRINTFKQAQAPKVPKPSGEGGMNE